MFAAFLLGPKRSLRWSLVCRTSSRSAAGLYRGILQATGCLRLHLFRRSVCCALRLATGAGSEHAPTTGAVGCESVCVLTVVEKALERVEMGPPAWRFTRRRRWWCRWLRRPSLKTHALRSGASWRPARCCSVASLSSARAVLRGSASEFTLGVHEDAEAWTLFYATAALGVTRFRRAAGKSTGWPEADGGRGPREPSSSPFKVFPLGVVPQPWASWVAQPTGAQRPRLLRRRSASHGSLGKGGCQH